MEVQLWILEICPIIKLYKIVFFKICEKIVAENWAPWAMADALCMNLCQKDISFLYL